VKSLSFGNSAFPNDAVARIFKPSRSVMRSSENPKLGWRLVFEPRVAPVIDPLTGCTGSADPLSQVELRFPTLRAAINYADRQGLSYVVQNRRGAISGSNQENYQSPNKRSRAFSDATLARLELSDLQESYGDAMAGAADRNDASGPTTWSKPMDVVNDRSLSLEAKRSILMNWAWTEYLLDQATNEGMPENNRPSRLHEVDQAMLALERAVETKGVESRSDQHAA
jgi:hypothetical protein